MPSWNTAAIDMRCSISLLDSALARVSSRNYCHNHAVFNLFIRLVFGSNVIGNTAVINMQYSIFLLGSALWAKCHLGYCCHLYAVFEYLTGFGFSGSIDILDTTAVIVRYSISLLGSASLAQLAYQNIAAIGVRYKISLLDSVFLTRRLSRNATATIMQ